MLKLHAALIEFVWTSCNALSLPGVVLWFGSGGMHCRAVMEEGRGEFIPLLLDGEIAGQCFIHLQSFPH